MKLSCQYTVQAIFGESLNYKLLVGKNLFLLLNSSVSLDNISAFVYQHLSFLKGKAIRGVLTLQVCIGSTLVLQILLDSRQSYILYFNSAEQRMKASVGYFTGLDLCLTAFDLCTISPLQI